jgi:hypothetical protein
LTAGLAAGAVCAFSVLSVHASLRDDDTGKIVQDPSFYFGVAGDYGRMELKDGGLSLMKPGFPNKGIIDKDVASGSLLFGIDNLIDLDGTVSLRGEIEYQ